MIVLGGGSLTVGKPVSKGCLSASGVFVVVSFSGRGGVRIDSESEPDDSVSSVFVEMVRTEEDRGGSSLFLPSLGFVTMSRGIGGTGGGLCEASIGGGGGAKGGNFSWNGILRTWRNMAEACAGQMAKNKVCTAPYRRQQKEAFGMAGESGRRTRRPGVYKSGFKYRVIQRFEQGVIVL